MGSNSAKVEDQESAKASEYNYEGKTDTRSQLILACEVFEVFLDPDTVLESRFQYASSSPTHSSLSGEIENENILLLGR